MPLDIKHKESSPIFELHDADVERMFDVLDKSDVVMKSAEKASAEFDKISDSFVSTATKTPYSLPGAIDLADIYGIVNRVYYRVPIGAEEIGELHASANMSGRCSIHKMMLETDIQRSERLPMSL